MQSSSLQKKQARILIADADPNRRFGVEKQLNQLGYLGIATAASFAELMALLDYPGRPFDAVLINCALLDPDSTGTWDALHKQQNVFLYRNSLFSSRINDPAAVITEGFADLIRGHRTLH